MTTLPAPRALVVDDGPLNRLLMTALLEKLGCIVETAASGEEAVQKCAEETYDVAFVDLHMPGIDGRETVRAMREAESTRVQSRVPVVVLTADDAPPPGDQAWFDLFVSKPITGGLLKAAFEVLAANKFEQPTVMPTEPADAMVDELVQGLFDGAEATMCP